MRTVNLYRRDGSVCGQAKVDDEDFERLSQWRWSMSRSGYAWRGYSDGGRSMKVWMHREVVKPDDGFEVDHWNRDKLDNTRENLRVATHAENLQNQSLRKTSRSGYRGVDFHKASGRWRARAKVGNQHKHLGLFGTPEEAAKVASAFRASHMPFSEEAAT